MNLILMEHLACLVLVVCLVALALWQRVSFARRVAEIEARSLRGQLNPHFLFNALNGISELGYGDPDAADRAITQLSGLLRKSLDNGHRQIISLRAEFDFLGDYLALQRVLTHDGLTVSLELDPAVRNARIPAMLLQPLVENALTHGRGAGEGGNDIRVSAKRVKRQLEIEVRDHGPGLQPVTPFPGDLEGRPGSGIGLTNTRARLRILCGAETGITLRNAIDGGVIARVTLPYCEAP